ncbi:MAG: nuclear transport factor 2 family protein, partial [Alphaproteobacteria bacterium]|nr:nuclear transport factor 2 family protein [Alphaproteobacteria bacterium]
MEPRALLDAFTAAVERRDGKAFARLFAEDGVYHDGFYGVFQGRDRVAELIDDWFYRTAEDFRWDMNEPVSDGRKLYAHYVFSYRSKLAGA